MTRESMRIHRQSEELASSAEILMANNDIVRAKELYKQAAVLEEKAVNGFSSDKPQTLAILVLSTCALYYKAGDFDKTYEIATRFLALKEIREQDYYRNHLENILHSINYTK